MTRIARNLCVLLCLAALMTGLALGKDDPAALPALKDVAPEVVIEVNGVAITRDQLAAACILLSREQAAQRLFRLELVRQEAARTKVTVTQEEVDAYVEKQVEQEVAAMARSKGFASVEAFEPYLKEMGDSTAKLRKRVRQVMAPMAGPELLLRKMLRAKIKVTDEDVRALFAVRHGPRVMLRRIALQTREAADGVLKRLRLGADFAGVAATESLDRASAARGGLIAPEPADGELGKAVGGLKEGEMTGVLEIAGGFQIVKLEERIPADLVAFEDKKDALREELVNQRMQRMMEPWLSELAVKAETKVHLFSEKDEEETMKVALASRVQSLPVYLFGKLNAVKYEKRRDGVDIIDLGMGNPLDPTPKPVVQKLCEAVKDPRNHRYSTATGIFNLKREVAREYERRYGVEVDPAEEIVCTIGSKEGFSHLCLALVGPGDTVIVPQPAFPIHVSAVRLADGNVIGTPLGTEEQMVRDVDRLMRTLTPKPKAIVLNFPHNPTAKTVSLDFFEDMARLARKHRLFVLSDLAYGATTFDGYEPPSFLQTRYGKEVGVEFTTMSKAFNMAGWRIGYCVGNRHAIQALARVKAYYDYGIFQPVQIAAIIALRQCREESVEQALRYQGRRDVLCDGLDRAGWDIERPRASMFVWAKIPQPYARMGSVKFAFELMEKANVAVAPGAGFGPAGEGYLRMALVENEKRLRQAARQIRRAFPVG